MAFCQNCGHNVAQAAFCTACGTPSGGAPAQAAGSYPPSLSHGPPSSFAATAAAAALQPPPRTDAADSSQSARILQWFLLADTLLAAISLLPLFADSPGSWFRSFQFWLGVATAGVWLHWLRAAYRRLTQTQGVQAKRGTILCWFIPPMNLIRPFQLVRYLWNSSGDPTSALTLYVWWAACLVWFFLKMFDSLFTGDKLFNAFNLASAIDFGIRITAFLAPATAYLIVGTIAGFQDKLLYMAGAVLTSAKRYSLPVLTLSAVGAGCSAVATLSLVLGSSFLEPTPEQSLMALGQTFQEKDLAGFRSYCNMQSVVDNGLEDLLFGDTFISWELAKVPVGHIWVLLTNALAADLLEHYYTPGVAYRMETGLVLGEVDIQVNHRFAPPDILRIRKPNEIMRQVLQSSFQKVEVTHRFGKYAIARAHFNGLDGITSRPISIELAMLHVRDHWQITAIRDITVAPPTHP
jgi:hypothetical protein